MIVSLKGNRNTGKVLGLCGYMDVVPTGDRQWAYEHLLRKKAMAMIPIKRSRFGGRCETIGIVGQEAGAVGAKQLVEEWYADDLDAIIIAELTKSNIVVTHKGAFWVAISCYGKTAHDSRLHHGVNALLHMNEIMKRCSVNVFR